MFYHGKTYTSIATGQRVMPVSCERCNTAFFYALVRQGRGSATAPYGLGKKSAQRRSAESAQKNLAARLACEQDLVACPTCHWVNQALVIGYRRTRYRPLKILGIAGGAIVWVSVLVSVFCINHTDPTPLMAAVISIVAATVLAAPVAAGLLGLQWLLRRRIDPNRNFPQPPVLPVASPKAWTNEELAAPIDAASADAYRPDPAADRYPGWAVFRAGHLVIPPGHCCECLAPANTTYRERFTLNNSGTALKVPLCQECQSRLRITWWSSALQSSAVILLIAGLIYYLARFDVIGNAIAALIFAFFGILVGLAIIPNRLTRPYQFRRIDQARSVFRIRFRNEQFTEMVRLSSENHERAVFQPPPHAPQT